jgi:hypothetical protein
MANELPRKPIKRVTVPTVSKELPKESPEETKGRTSQNVLLFCLFLLVSGIVYIAIFQRKYFSDFSSNKPVVADSSAFKDTLSVNNDSLASEEYSTILGQDKPSNKKKGPVVYPAGTRFYLVAGTFIFYPYAEKFRDKMKAEGYQADIISTGENRQFHRIYIESSEDATSIRAKRDQLRSSRGMDVWVYAE